MHGLISLNTNRLKERHQMRLASLMDLVGKRVRFDVTRQNFVELLEQVGDVAFLDGFLKGSLVLASGNVQEGISKHIHDLFTRRPDHDGCCEPGLAVIGDNRFGNVLLHDWVKSLDERIQGDKKPIRIFRDWACKRDPLLAPFSNVEKVWIGSLVSLWERDDVTQKSRADSSPR